MSHALTSVRTQIILLIASSLLVLPTPWFFGNVTRLTLAVGGLLLILLVIGLQRFKPPVLPLTLVFIVYSSVALSLYLLPLPLELWLHLPGREFYRDSLQVLQANHQALAQHTLSLDPYATAHTLLSILPALALFLAISSLDEKRLSAWVHLLVAMVAIQAAWGLIQYSSTGIAARGSYINRDHYVTLMTFALPLAIALIYRHTSQPQEAHDSGKYTVLLAFYLGTATLIFLGGFFSMSRAGIPNLFIGIILTTLLLSRKARRLHSVWFMAGFLLFVLLLAYFTGFIPVINRFIGQDPLEDARWIMFAQQWKAIQQFFPLGSGPGTFTDVYTAFQPLEQVGAGFVKHAHNDYLELLLETGVVGMSIVLFFAIIYVYGWIRLWGKRRLPLYGLQAAAGIGLLTSLLHAFFDFNFHTIPHPLIFAALAGLFLHRNLHTAYA